MLVQVRSASNLGCRRKTLDESGGRSHQPRTLALSGVVATYLRMSLQEWYTASLITESRNEDR